MTIGMTASMQVKAWPEFVMPGALVFSTAGSRDRDTIIKITHQQEGTTMAVTADSKRRSLSKFKRAESLEFRLIFVAAFAVFLFAATVERLIPIRRLLRGGEASAHQSLFEQAKAAANTCAAYAFMG